MENFVLNALRFREYRKSRMKPITLEITYNPYLNMEGIKEMRISEEWTE